MQRPAQPLIALNHVHADRLFGGLLGDGASIGEAFRDYRRAKRIMRVATRP